MTITNIKTKKGSEGGETCVKSGTIIYEAKNL